MSSAPTASAPLVRASDLAFAYRLARGGQRPVLAGVSLQVERGELVALVGANGSGKTTLLRLLAGTLTADGGELELFGRPALSWSRIGLARRVAVLPQSLELPAGFPVGELVAMGRLPHARSLFGSTAEDDEAVERALRDADAVDLAARTVDELSGGERQRVLVAMALAQEPELLLLDEPTLHLDLAHQVAVLETMARLRETRGMAVLAVLHDLSLVLAAAPRVIVLDGGRVAADGPPAATLTPELIGRVFGVRVELLTDGRGVRHMALSLGRSEPSPSASASHGRDQPDREHA